ncbi:MAG: exodeoxyribonuclease III, partial [Holosporaceae bacterium]|nr:exodeoxyribonuclease III [Holosporaceae bacterium]
MVTNHQLFYTAKTGSYKMILISFNVNGLRAAIASGLVEFFDKLQADIILLQETKVDVPVDLSPLKYQSVWHFSKRKGYSGTVVLFKNKPIDIQYGFNNNVEINDEGRIITLEYPLFFIVNVYVPNSQGTLDRWYYRLDWDTALYRHLSDLCARKPVIIGGDFNIAHNYIDIYPENTKNIQNRAGFREEERCGFDNLLELGFIDTFRFMHSHECGSYTWWSEKNENRKYNRGRR